MDIDMRRLNLRAALQKLVDEIDIPSSVQTCYENMAAIFDEVDEVRHLQRHRGSSGWTDVAINRIIPARIGNFAAMVRTKKKGRTITFTQEDTSIEFNFERLPQTARTRLDSILKRASTGSTDAEQQAAATAVLQSVARQALTGEDKRRMKSCLKDRLWHLTTTG
jgi:hypothetical protein